MVWGNAHGLVIFGVAMAGAVLLEALLWSRDEIKRAALVVAACVAAPMVSPLGWNYWPQILSTVSLARELQIQEYQMPLRPQDLPFWAGLGALIVLAILQRRRLSALERADRILLLGALVLALAAVTTARNVAFFARRRQRPRYRAYGPLARRWSRPRGDVSGPSVRSGGACA